MTAADEFELRIEDGILRVFPLPSEEKLQEFYESRYFQQQHGNFAEEYEADELEFFDFKNRLFHQVIRDHLGLESLAGLSLLDVGCGEGFTLRYFDRQGVNVSGADFSVAGIARHNPELLKRISFLQCDVTRDRPFCGATFDLISVNGVLEHMLDPLGFLASARSYCHDRSLMFVSVPNEYNSLQMEYLADAPLESAPWFSPPEHLSYFNPGSITGALLSAGFDVLYLGTGFPIEQFLFHPETDYYRRPSAGKIAHAARKRFLKAVSRNMSQALQLCSAFAAANIGRDLMIVARRKPI